ncbi:MAG: TetR family transcriptional regulator [Hyphomicrobiaceae bacterium]|nr:TetR family transcriptional regulator [Hyphomicrobiaceae bacterium]MCC0009689.1 TetR family transcriptional regulator [Hyphomicrobiaceae bacterium]
MGRSSVEPKPSNPATKRKQVRDPIKTRQKILKTATREFQQHGFSGARVERIATKSKSNMRMIYHYFGDKEGLYLAVLEAAYLRIREQERSLDLSDIAPDDGMRALIRFTFDFFAENQDVLALINGENMLRARYLRKLPNVRAMTVPLIDSISNMLDRGERRRIFRSNIDPVQIYVSIVALSQLHILNRHTLSVIFDADLSSEEWLGDRREHVEYLIMSYVTS